jgi:hypothetical protein
LKLALAVIRDLQFFACILIKVWPFNHQTEILIFFFIIQLSKQEFSIEIEVKLDGPSSSA